MIWNYQIYYPSDMTLPKSKQSVWMKQISTYRALNITHYAVWFAQIIEYMNFTFIFFTAERKKDIFTDHFPESVKQWVMTIYKKKSHKHTNELMGAHACARVHTHTAKKQQKHDSNNSHTNITYIHTHTHTHMHVNTPIKLKQKMFLIINSQQRMQIHQTTHLWEVTALLIKRKWRNTCTQR